MLCIRDIKSFKQNLKNVPLKTLYTTTLEWLYEEAVNNIGAPPFIEDFSQFISSIKQATNFSCTETDILFSKSLENIRTYILHSTDNESEVSKHVFFMTLMSTHSTLMVLLKLEDYVKASVCESVPSEIINNEITNAAFMKLLINLKLILKMCPSFIENFKKKLTSLKQ